MSRTHAIEGARTGHWWEQVGSGVSRIILLERRNDTLHDTLYVLLGGGLDKKRDANW